MPVRIAAGPRFLGVFVRREGPERRFVYIAIGVLAGGRGERRMAERVVLLRRDVSPELNELADFLGFFVDTFVNADGHIGPEVHPLTFVNQMMATAPKRVLSGLKMAVGDCLESSDHWSPDKVQETDASMRAAGVVTLSEMRRRYSRRFKAILTRGKIRSEEEYYLVKAIATDTVPPTEQAVAVRSLLAAFEESVVERRQRRR